jgi:hypothetical protein
MRPLHPNSESQAPKPRSFILTGTAVARKALREEPHRFAASPIACRPNGWVPVMAKAISQPRLKLAGAGSLDAARAFDEKVEPKAVSWPIGGGQF